MKYIYFVSYTYKDDGINWETSDIIELDKPPTNIDDIKEKLFGTSQVIKIISKLN